MARIEITGKYATAVIHAADGKGAPDQHAIAQVQMLCDTEACSGARIRVMPDVHAGRVGPVGLTMPVGERVMPALIGGDIGCGVTAVRVVAKGRPDLAKLDKAVREACEGAARAGAALDDARLIVGSLRCSAHVQAARAEAAVGTLGGGNHFVELDRGGDGSLYLVVHSGSRILGQQVFDHYMREGRRELGDASADVPYETTWLEGKLARDYSADVRATCLYSQLNRETIVSAVCRKMKWSRAEAICSQHNFIDKSGMLRKGAVRAREGDPVIIPVNMRDGAILGVGRGNPDWNESAPHGAGRTIRRSDVASSHTVSEFRKEMDGVWTSCIGAGTLDEAPFAYRSIGQIEGAIGDAVRVTDVLRPVYVFKNGGSVR